MNERPKAIAARIKILGSKNVLSNVVSMSDQFAKYNEKSSLGLSMAAVIKHKLKNDNTVKIAVKMKYAEAERRSELIYG